ncbi:MAG: GNAT family N-acetyltransferase, partial [Actinobacteria bacterium]|nr:GNAT family N-acetyltransferase [Actinomycetota bacterium]
MPLPPDRSHVRTEARNPASAQLDRMDAAAIAALMAADAAAVPDAVAAAAPAIGALVEAMVPRVRQGGRLVYFGAGTSGRLGVLDASECPPTFMSDPWQVVGIIAGGDGALRRSSEGREDEPDGAREEIERLGIGPLDTVVGIAAGGTTPYPRGAVRLAKARGAATAFVACVPMEPPEGCDHLIVLDTGPEVLTGSTRLKAGSATKLALNCITTALFVRLGKVRGNLMVDLAATNDKLVDRAIRTVRQFDPTRTREEAWALLEANGRSVKRAIEVPNWQPTLEGTLVRARPLRESDRDATHAAASDPLIWEQHSARDRHERPVFDRYFGDRLATAGALAVEDRRGGIVGLSGYYDWNPADRSVVVGYTFLARPLWGTGANAELKRLMLDHAFRWADTVWFHVSPRNVRSQRALAAIGARLD